ncbi:MAG: XRE family transcriptional regulator [Clostridia bacterium]|jgi:transcriptional regulator with XRE-family HTH domain|nr:XRE family transcriptional regulator [Clostridia bacterium]MCI1999786.1 XRE family transcriptional regulator [Clostridia bacterium]MCI2014298.1 XRE family transcriptional regulator [Clostridia bacterium]
MLAKHSAENLNQIIAKNLKELRRVRGITLDDAAEATGVSKSMLGQIERCECGPSVATLWKISTGLKISFTYLMTEEHSDVYIVDNKEMVPLTNGNPGFRLYPVFPIGPGQDFEILYIELDSGAISSSTPHEKGTEEFTLVYAGTLELHVSDKIYSVKAGHSIHYSGDQPHSYANRNDDMVQICMVIRYGNNSR